MAGSVKIERGKILISIKANPMRNSLYSILVIVSLVLFLNPTWATAQVNNELAALTEQLASNPIQQNDPFPNDDPFSSQTEQVQQQKKKTQDKDKSDDDKSDDDKSDADKSDKDKEDAASDTASVSEPEEAVNPQMVRLHMWDGTIVSGEVEVKQVDIKTEFGMLAVPVSSIQQFFPGLDSFPQLNKKIEQAVESLGDGDFDARTAAHQDLLNMGAMLRYEIERFDDGGSAERKKHLVELRNEIGEMLEDEDELEQQIDVGLIRGDTIVTSNFTIVGKIQQSDFKLKSKFGELRVELADIKRGDREFSSQKAEIKKVVTIPGKTFFQKNPKSTKIRVNKGDVISIKGEGNVNWQNWGNVNSGPGGITNQGQWRGHNCGTLMARIGTSGDKYIKIGSKNKFTAKKSGVLYLAIAMQDNYANNNGYNWGGELKAKITVQPVAK